MSFYRAKLRATDRNVYYDNRLTNFTNPHVYYGNLHVEHNETVGGDLDVCGNLHVGKDLTARSYYATGNFYLDNYLLIPYGTIIQSAAVVVPDGWLLCNGALLSRFDYSDLFGVLLYTYGGSDNSFNIPDLRGRTVIGAGQGYALSNYDLGDLGGEETHTLSVNEMPRHSHTSNAIGNTIGLITANGQNTANSVDNVGTGEPNLYAALPALTIDTSGNSYPHNNMQPYFALNYLIKY